MSLAAIVGSLLIVALAELLRPRRRREFPALRRRLGNIGIWLLNVVLAGFVFAAPATFRPQLEAAFGLTLPAWPIADAALGFVVGFLLLDLLQYAIHRCQHAVPFLWRLHALHHSDPDVDVTTSVRHHPLEYLFAAASITHGNTRLPDSVERWLQPVFITLDLHLVHHSLSPAEANANFGALFSIWDRLCGTYTRLPRAEQERIVFGVRELSRRDA